MQSQPQHPAPSNLQPMPPVPAPMHPTVTQSDTTSILDVKAAPWYQQPQYGWLIHIATVVGSTALAALVQAALNSLNGAATCNPSLTAAQCAPAFNPATLTLLNALGSAVVSYIRNQGTIISVPTTAGGN